MTIRAMRWSALMFVACGHASPPPANPPPTPPPPPPTPADAAAATSPPAPTSPPVAIGACAQGTYSLGPAAAYPIKHAIGALALGDLNGDGHPDLVVGDSDDRGTGRVGLLLGAGGGSFTSPAQYPLTDRGEAYSIALADFDTDNDLDIVTLGGAGTPEVYLNNGDGTFGTPLELPAPPGGALAPGRTGAVRVIDLDHDNKPEIVEHAGGRVIVWTDSGHAQFTATEAPSLGKLDAAGGLALDDFDHDGTPDLAIAGRAAGAGVVAVELGRPKRGFAALARYTVAVDGAPQGIVAADFDGDHKVDLAALFAGPSGGKIAVLPGAGNGSFGAARILDVPGARDGATLAIGDLGSDGKADLIVTTADGVAVFRSQGKTFAPPVVVPAAGSRALAVGDVRGDGTLGVAATVGDSQVVVWPGNCR